MTREQILVELRKVNRTCRGNAALAQSVRDAMFTEWQQCADDASKTAFLQKLLSTLGRPADTSGIVPQELHIQGLLFSFNENCGADFNDVIGTYPFDGRLYEVTCPVCGAPQLFQSPLEG